MSASEPDRAAGSPPNQWFTTTHWSVVLTASDTSAPGAQDALEKLCRTYWYPLYAYVRREGYSPEDAQDLTQSFFERFLEKRYLDDVSREKGKFRSFLLVAIKHVLSDERRHQQRQKRGGGKRLTSLDERALEDCYRLEPADELDPEKLFERRWALTLLEQVLTRLAAEYAAAGKAQLFGQLQVFLLGEKKSATYAQVAQGLNMSEGAVKVAVHRLRQRYGELFRTEIAHTVATRDDIDDEIRHLRKVLAS